MVRQAHHERLNLMAVTRRVGTSNDEIKRFVVGAVFNRDRVAGAVAVANRSHDASLIPAIFNSLKLAP
jgi:hypothetical protein